MYIQQEVGSDEYISNYKLLLFIGLESSVIKILGL